MPTIRRDAEIHREASPAPGEPVGMWAGGRG